MIVSLICFYVSQAVRSNLKSESCYLSSQNLVVPIFFFFLVGWGTVLMTACKIVCDLGPGTSLLSSFNPHILLWHTGFIAVAHTLGMLHLRTFALIIPSAHEILPPDTCMVKSLTSLSHSANVILSIRLFMTFGLKLQPPSPIPSILSTPQSILIICTFSTCHFLAFFFYFIFDVYCLLSTSVY